MDGKVRVGGNIVSKGGGSSKNKILYGIRMRIVVGDRGR